MSKRRIRKWLMALASGAGGGVLLQTGCAIDPDLTFQAVSQLLTELAIFLTDSAITNLR